VLKLQPNRRPSSQPAFRRAVEASGARTRTDDRPKLILLDEPFAGVNPILTNEIGERIRVLNAEGIGFSLSSTTSPRLARLASTMFAMDHGAVISSGTPEQVLSDASVRAAYVGAA